MQIDVHVFPLFVVMHEDLFQGQVFDGQVGDLAAADQFCDRVDVALVEETDRTVFCLQVGDPFELEAFLIQVGSCHADLLVIILLQALDILDIDDAAFLDDRHPVAEPLHLSQEYARRRRW